MDVKKCFVCGNDLTLKNDSREHILLHNFGATKSVKGLICKDCNNWLGTVVDQPFIDSMQDLYNFISKNNHPTILTKNGRKYRAITTKGKIDNKPIVAVKPIINTSDSNVEAVFYNNDDKKQYFEKKKNRLERKGKTIDILTETTTKDMNPEFDFDFDFDPKSFTLELLKIQTEYLHSNNLISNLTLGDKIFSNAKANKDNDFQKDNDLIMYIFYHYFAPVDSKIFEDYKNKTHYNRISCNVVDFDNKLECTYISIFQYFNVLIPFLNPSNIHLFVNSD